MCSELKSPTSRVYPSGSRAHATQRPENGEMVPIPMKYINKIYINKSYEAQRDVRLTAVRPQYSRLINTSKGALATARAFLAKNSFGLRVKSARNPKIKVKVDIDRAIILEEHREVRYLAK